jgi:hypothetical protein
LFYVNKNQSKLTNKTIGRKYCAIELNTLENIHLFVLPVTGSPRLEQLTGHRRRTAYNSIAHSVSWLIKAD